MAIEIGSVPAFSMVVFHRFLSTLTRPGRFLSCSHGAHWLRRLQGTETDVKMRQVQHTISIRGEDEIFFLADLAISPQGLTEAHQGWKYVILFDVRNRVEKLSRRVLE